MSTEQIEERLARLEREMAELRERIEARDRPWWERLPKIDPQMFDEMQPYSGYIRQTATLRRTIGNPVTRSPSRTIGNELPPRY